MTVAEVAQHQALDAARPWPGLEAFSEDLRAFFFGRSAETEELFRRVRNETVTLLFGQSGLGKTSLLGAGLAPRLRAAGFLPVFVRLIYGEDALPPATQVKEEFWREVIRAQAETALIGLEESLWGYFHRTDRTLIGRAGEVLTPVLIFDQFEEIFTLGLASETSRGAAQSFLGELAELIENRPPDVIAQALESDADVLERYDFDRQDYRILVTLREDYLAQLDNLRQRAPLLGRNYLRLRRMSGRQGFDAVTKPIPDLIASGVAQEILRFIGRASPEDAFGMVGDNGEALEVEPALLSLVCRELNERRIALDLDHISPDLLEGNRDAIIQSFYDAALADQPEALRSFVEDELLSESGFRESVSLDRARRLLAAAGVTASALDRLVTRRLLRVEERLDLARVEIIHDVLTPVIRASRDRRHVRQAAAAAAARERELRRARRRTRFAYAAAGLMALLLVVAIGLGVWARKSNREAEQQKALAEQQKALAEQQKMLAEQKTDIAEREKAAAQHSLDLAIGVANALVFDVVQKYRYEGVPTTIVADILARVGDLQQQLAADSETSPALRRSQADALDETVDTLLTIGDAKGAFVAATQARDILKALLAAAPDSTDYQRALSVGDEKIGDVLEAQGDFAGALTQYRTELAIMEPLAKKDPGNTDWQRFVSVVDEKIGDVLKEQHDLARALAQYRTELAIMEPLAKKDPGNTDWQRSVSVAHEKIGNALEAQGDLAGALAAYRDSLTISKVLAQKDPGNTKWLRSLSVNDEEFGRVLKAQGDLAGALARYREMLAIDQRLAEKDPSNAESQRDLSVDHEKIGDLLKAQGDLAGALTQYRTELGIMEPLAKKHPSNTDWQRFVSVVNEKIGDLRASDQHRHPRHLP
jgi:tetratricopeptide (TPR) repeat protein